MTRLTRRSVLGGSALGAIGFLGREGGGQPLNPPRSDAATCIGGGPQRISVGGLWADHPVLEKYRTAIRKMQALPTSDPRNWTKIAQVHNDYCPHGNWYIWPWHRAYLVSFERVCRQLSGYDNFRLPYWDWTANRQMPATFMQPEYNKLANPLFDKTRTVLSSDSLPDDTFGPTNMQKIISQNDFEMFMSFHPTGQSESDSASSWQRTSGAKGPLEHGPHDYVHSTFVGGDMSFISTSPLDPIFWLHHANLDRIWDVWNRQGHANTTKQSWRNFRFSGQFRNPDGTIWEPFVSDLLNTVQLGYSYPYQDPFPGLVAQPSLPSPFDWNRVTRTVTEIAGEAVATTAEPLSVALRCTLPVPQLIDRALRPVSPESIAVAGRVVAFIAAELPANALSPQVRVFLNCDYLSPETPPFDPHYVGSFTFFGGGHAHTGHDHAGSDGTTRFALDLTDTLLALEGVGRLPTESLVLQLQPVAIHTLREAAPVKIRSVELVVA
jgi:tyrosinase